jgi:hypothetical protein
MLVKDIIQAQKYCFIQDKESCGYCSQCPLKDTDYSKDCQVELAKATVEKLQELTQLLDDKVNHHYYDTLEALQEDNINLREKIERAVELLND